jgi:hypothetical protein
MQFLVESYNRLIEQKGLSDILNLWNCAFEVKGFGEDNLEDLQAMSVQIFELEKRQIPFEHLYCDSCC